MKSKIIKCKTNNQQNQISSYNILTPNGSSSTTIRSIDVPNEHASIKLHIRRVCSPSSSTETLSIHPTTNLLCQSEQLNDESKKFIPKTSRRIITTRRTSLIESDLSHITSPINNIYDENTLKNQTTKINGFKRKFQNDQQEKKRQKLLNNKNTLIQTRSSSRLKQKHQSNHRLSTIKRSLSTELLTTLTSDLSTSTDDIPYSEYKYLYLSSSSSKIQLIDNQCQTNDDIIEIFHQSIQTNCLIKFDKSTYTDFIDQPLCENSTQTIQKIEQETQTTDLNCPNDSQVNLTSITTSQTQCDRIISSNSSQQKLSSPFRDLSLTNSNNDRLQLFQSLIHTEEHPNGGASLIRTYYNEYIRLSTENINLFVNYFFNLVYGEVNQRAKYSIGVLHDGARYLPDLVDYFSLTYPKMTVKTTNIFNSKEVLTTTMGEYRNRILQTYSNGTFRYGPLMSISLVGIVTGKEECGKNNK
jgi:hypothetical protein